MLRILQLDRNTWGRSNSTDASVREKKLTWCWGTFSRSPPQKQAGCWSCSCWCTPWWHLACRGTWHETCSCCSPGSECWASPGGPAEPGSNKDWVKDTRLVRQWGSSEGRLLWIPPIHRSLTSIITDILLFAAHSQTVITWKTLLIRMNCCRADCYRLFISIQCFFLHWNTDQLWLFIDDVHHLQTKAGSSSIWRCLLQSRSSQVKVRVGNS